MQTDSQQLAVSVADADLVLVHGPGGWRCVADPPVGACVVVYQRAVEAALAGAGLAAALNALIVDPRSSRRHPQPRRCGAQHRAGIGGRFRSQCLRGAV